MRILMVSDIHYSSKPFHGLDESRAFDWLYRVVEKEQPDLLLSAGDFGEEVTEEMFKPILDQTSLFTVYGNHDNLGLIKKLRNKDGKPCLIEDGSIRRIDDLAIGGINDNIAQTKKRPRHKAEQEVLQFISMYERKKVDIFTTHEAPQHPQISISQKALGYVVLNEVIEKLKPKVYLCGHVHLPSQNITIHSTSKPR